MPGQGRPRSTDVDAAIHRATLEILDRAGYPGLSIEAVARHAGVGKPSVYRRFRSRAELAFATLMHGLAPDPAPDTGSLRDDLRALLAGLAQRLSAPLTRRAMPSLVGELHDDPRLLARFADTFVAHQRRTIAVVLDRAVVRGELTRRPDIEVVQALLVGPVYSWLFVLGEQPPADSVRIIADIVAAGLRSAGHE